MNLANHTAATAEGCCPSCGSSNDAPEDTVQATVCTLGTGEFKQRVADIRNLAHRSPRRSERQGLTLRLTYDRDVQAEVEDIVAKESVCCGFLAFDPRHDAFGVQLAITAPASAAEVADELFTHFAPELERQTS